MNELAMTDPSVIIFTCMLMKVYSRRCFRVTINMSYLLRFEIRIQHFILEEKVKQDIIIA